MGNGAISNNIGVGSTEALNTAPSEGQATDKKPGLFSKAAGNLAKALGDAMKFLSNNKLALASAIVASTITFNPIVGLAVFLAIAAGKDFIEAATTKPPEKQPKVEKQVAPEASAP